MNLSKTLNCLKELLESIAEEYDKAQRSIKKSNLPITMSLQQLKRIYSELMDISFRIKEQEISTAFKIDKTIRKLNKINYYLEIVSNNNLHYRKTKFSMIIEELKEARVNRS